MRIVRQVWDWLRIASVAPELAIAQYGELQRQIPLLYALLSVNAAALAFTHRLVAPLWMTALVPGLLVAVCALRLVVWALRPPKADTGPEAVHLLRRTTILAALLSVAYTAWALSLNSYGGMRENAHVAIFIAITVVGCITCLMHLPQAALAVTTIVTVPYLVYYVGLSDSVYAAISFNIVLVMMVLIRVLLNTFRGFDKLVRIQGETTRLNREVTLLAHTDMLTGLPNRRMFFAELDREIDEARRCGGALSLGVFDLDRFKAANDTFGHLVGDRLLEAVGARLREAFGPERLVARLGGDEFAFVVRTGGAEAAAFADAVCARLSEPFLLGDLTISIGASCGIADAAAVNAGARALYDSADYALYNAKSHRRGFSTLYCAEHETRIRSERAVEAALQSADFEAEMAIHLQPIVRVEDGSVMAVEALARWTSPTLGSVPPDVFIPIAERGGLIHRLTLALLEKALSCLAALPPDIKLSFNLSAHDLASTETVLGMVALIRRLCPDPSRLILELTETAVLRDVAAAEEAIGCLRALGVRIALDDFGTGQSSLSYLRRLKIDKVKIDRSFVAGASEPAGRELLSAVVALCRSMQMRCIAEGVEEAAQLQILREIGCDAFQGYYFARPMPLGEVIAPLAGAWAKSA